MRDRIDQRRSMHQLTETCNSQITFWNYPIRVITALLLPILASKNAKDLEKLACWTAKEPNLASVSNTGLVYDVGKVRHAVLQSRAATDFFYYLHRAWLRRL